MRLYDGKGSSCHCKQPQPILHPHLCPWHDLQWNTHQSDGMLKSPTAPQPSPQYANDVRRAPAHCHVRATSRVRVTPLTVHLLHPQCARILTMVCANDTHWLRLAVSSPAHTHVPLLGHHAPAFTRQVEQTMGPSMAASADMQSRGAHPWVNSMNPPESRPLAQWP